jgi:hypothetical protein
MLQMSEALWIEAMLWIYGVVIHSWVNHTITPLVSWHDYGMRLP